MNAIRNILKKIATSIGKRNPELMARIRYRLRFHKRLNLDNPETLNEKIHYLSLRTDTREWTRLSDKYAVRDYVRECGLDHILNKLYGVWNSVYDIDFQTLPEKFVIKTTHGCGDSIIVKNQDEISLEKVRKEIDSRLHEKWGLSEGNIHYSRIIPRVIVEELLENDPVSARFSTSLIDYKIWCFGGKARYILTCSNRTDNQVNLMLYDVEWREHPKYLVFSRHFLRDAIIPRPKGLEQMIEYAEKLSSPFPVVRVDMYNLDGKILFGEMTFTSLGGFMNYFSDDFLMQAGKLITIP